MRKYMMHYYYERKKQLFELLGNKCFLCNSTINLQFDHIDKHKKKFGILSSPSIALDRLLKELKKCRLLCKKCHDKKTKKNNELGIDKIGSKNPASKLTEKQVVKIKCLLKNNISSYKIAPIYNVARATIQSIKRGITWRHV